MSLNLNVSILSIPLLTPRYVFDQTNFDFFAVFFSSSDAKNRRPVILGSALIFETDMISVILLLNLVSNLQTHSKVSCYILLNGSEGKQTVSGIYSDFFSLNENR